MLQAAARGDTEEIDHLLRIQPGPDVRAPCNWTPLMKTALNGELEAAMRLLDADAGPNTRDKGGHTPLMLAASNNHATLVDLLLQRGALADSQEGTHGWTALIWAAKRGHLDAVRALLPHGADPRIRDDDGNTATDWARAQGHTRLSQLLQALPGQPR